jgi:hypothetical protein
MPNTYTIHTGCYDDKVYVVAPCTYEQALDWLKKKKIRDWDKEGIEEYKEARGLCCRRTSKSACIIFLKKWKTDDPESISILVHEVVHASNFILKESGVEDNGDESLCYLTHYIIKQVLTQDKNYRQKLLRKSEDKIISPSM